MVEFMNSIGAIFISIYDSIIHFFGFIEYMYDNFLEKFEDGIRLSLKYVTYFMFWFAEQALITAYEITHEFLDSFNYNEKINSVWSGLDPKLTGFLSVLKIPQCINVLVSAIGTKFTLKFIPFLN